MGCNYVKKIDRILDTTKYTENILDMENGAGLNKEDALGNCTLNMMCSHVKEQKFENHSNFNLMFGNFYRPLYEFKNLITPAVLLENSSTTTYFKQTTCFIGA